jgi:uncharacterized membrane protein YkoI
MKLQKAVYCVASWLVGAAFLTSTAMAQGEAGSEAARLRALTKKARVSLARAVEIAAKEVKGGKPFRAELQTDTGQAQYEVVLQAGEQCVTVKVDSTTGKVIEVDKEDLERTPGHRWSFDKETAGGLPAGWIVRQNNPTKGLAAWAVEPDGEAVSKPNVLNVKTANGNATYNLALVENTSYKNLNLTVRIRANSGVDDQGGGLIWRCKDENNYYVCRINPIENNYRVYRVVDGKRTMIQSVDFETPAGKWFTLRVRMKGNEIACYCNGKKWLEAKDDTFKDAGMIGLWTKADACSSFDNLQAWPILGETGLRAGPGDGAPR